MNTLSIALLLPSLFLGIDPPKLMGLAELEELAKAPAGKKIAYGPGSLQFGELTLPKGDGPHPVAIFIHGGCWLSAYDLASTRSIANALAAEGIAVWNLEYRRVGDEGGGWPGTFLDVAAGADHLKKLAGPHSLDLSRTIAIGHSAGGHLALWLAARHKVPAESELHSAAPLKLIGVVGLAPASELDELHRMKVCGHVIDKLMGGGPDAFPQRYLAGTPSRMAPLGVPQRIILGKYDESWAPIGRRYVRTAREAGDEQIKLIEAPDAGHFEVIHPKWSTWPLVRDAARQLLEQNVPD